MPVPAREWTQQNKQPDSAVTVRVLIVESAAGGVASLPEWEAVSQIEVLRAHSLTEGIFLVQHSRPDWILLDPDCRPACPDDLLCFLRHAAGIPMQTIAAMETEPGLNADMPCIPANASPMETSIGTLAAKVVRHAARRKQEKAATPAVSHAARLRHHSPEAFAHLAEAYRQALSGSVQELPYGTPPERSIDLQAIVRRLEELRAHPKDVVELHLAAMRAILSKATPQSSRVYLKEGQTLLLKVMGYLANQYLQASIHHPHESRSTPTRSAKRRSMVRTS